MEGEEAGALPLLSVVNTMLAKKKEVRVHVRVRVRVLGGRPIVS